MAYLSPLRGYVSSPARRSHIESVRSGSEDEAEAGLREVRGADESMRERICSFENCQKTESRVIVTLRSYFSTDSFCSIEHAIKFMVKKTVVPGTLAAFIEKFGDVKA